MTSIPTGFAFGSASSAQSVRDAIASYRRTQFLIAGSAVCSASDGYESFDEDVEEAIIRPRNEFTEDEFTAYEGRTDDTRADELTTGQFEWDDIEEQPAFAIPASAPATPHYRPVLPASPGASPRIMKSGERAPLLARPSSPSTRQITQESRIPVLPTHHQTYAATEQTPALVHVSSRTSLLQKQPVHVHIGKSTYGQTLFNSIAILLGIGMLSEPLAYAYSGWICGTLIIISYGFISCYTAKILAHIIMSDHRLRSYSDIGRKAFGSRATLPISLLFCLELFTVSVVLVTLYADSLYTIIPQYSPDTYKIWGLALLLPTVFLPLSLLSYASIMGILSIIFLIGVMLIDGLSKTDAPGSLWTPAETSWGPEGYGKLGVAFGLFMAGFSGHAVIPSLARDMVDPSQFDSMINWAFVIATSVYAIIGSAGYLMFGNNVSEEISIDLLNTPGYSAVLNQAVLWMLVISPLSKFALATQPLNTTLEILMGLDSQVTAPEEFSGKTSPRGSYIPLKKILHVLQRAGLTVASVAVSIYVPEFSAVMAFLGAFSAFVLCVIGPIGAKISLAGKCQWFDAIILIGASVMAIWGTVAAVWSS
ncbi:hypothetical protein PTI98_001503 [Pleurotus ostreatus]|nr:hypothetical protein PTI98_001503 [Pleurotus ostreatus]